jgi:hypothetical protein
LSPEFSYSIKFVACLKFKMNWQQGYAPPNSDRKEGILRRKRLEYLARVSQYYDILDTERSDDEINMHRQVFSMSIDFSIFTNVNLFCPIFDKLLLFFLLGFFNVSFFQQLEVQKSLERILCTWLVFIISCHLPCVGKEETNALVFSN